MFKFESLEVWKKSVEFAAYIYELIKDFPNWESYNLTSQIARAAVSISLNIAEGSSRTSKVDNKRFIQMSIGSLNEVVTCLYIAKTQKYVKDAKFKEAYEKCEEISRMLYGFSKYLEK